MSQSKFSFIQATGIRLLLVCSLAPFFLNAQETPDTSVFSRFRATEMDHSQIPDLAYNLLDVCGPRLTNSPGYNKSVKWSVQTMKDWGLKSAAESWGEYGKGWSNEETGLALKSPNYEQLVAYPVPWTNSTNGRISAGVIILDALDSTLIDKAGASIKGKIVLIRMRRTELPLGFDPNAQRYADTSLAKLGDDYMMTDEQYEGIRPFVNAMHRTKLYLESKGAVALLMASPRGHNGVVFVQNLLGYSSKLKPTLTEMALVAEDALKIQRLVDHKEPVTLELNVKNSWQTGDLNGYNVVAEIPGTDPALKDQVVMIGAHLDSWTAGTGATDNGAGCLVMMEAIRLIQQSGLKPKRTIRIALWGGEEQVLLGSWGYAKKHFGDPSTQAFTPEQKKLSAYYNLDNGSGKIRGIYLQENDTLAGLFASWLQPFADLGATTVTHHNTGSTDHLSFDAVGIPAFQFIQDPLDYETVAHHSNQDVSEHLSIPDLKQASIIVASLVWQTAQRPEMLTRKPLGPKKKFVFEGGLVE